ncbi:hypothetical protein KSP40_PGU020253 [Platanthera guangdongensis]|uniref:Uncharacterized protein n=1 Tax=Platanthera guangdongensis TaxID=2320717 RepID=A0ABR2LHF4_9ASPA
MSPAQNTLALLLPLSVTTICSSIMEEVPSNKRDRECSDESLNSPEKRLRSDLLLGIFDDDADTGSEDGLESVMKSLEEEIRLPSYPSQTPAEVPLTFGDPLQPDLGYLHEASDDELGLPPTVTSSEGEGCWEVDRACGDIETGFGQIWGFADEIPQTYDGLDLVAYRTEETESVAGETAGILDGEFGFFDEVYQPLDLAEFSWRPESLPAV